LKAGAKISTRLNDGRTPLHLAAQYGREDIVNLLIEHSKVLAEKEKNQAAAAAQGGKAKKKAHKMEEDDDDEDGGEEEDEEEKMEEDEEGEGEEGEDEEEEGDGDGGGGFFKKRKAEKEKERVKDEERFDINYEDWDNVRSHHLSHDPISLSIYQSVNSTCQSVILLC